MPAPSSSSSPCSIVVLGAGCFGLSSAITLQHAYPSLRVTIISRERTPFTTSDGAGALWRVVLPPHDAATLLMDTWAKRGYFMMAALLREYGIARTGLFWAHGVEFSSSSCSSESNMAHSIAKETPASQCSPLVTVDSPVPYLSTHVIDFHSMTKREMNLFGLPSRAETAYSFTSILADMTVYLKFLEQEFVRLGGTFIRATVHSLATASSASTSFSDNPAADEAISRASLLVNCLGLGNQSLLKDQLMKPIRGYLVRVACPSIKYWLCDNSGFSYIFPRLTDVVLGGTYEANEEDTSRNEKTAAEIIAECSKLIPDLATAPVLNHWCGLRPARETLRCQLEMPAELSCSASTSTIDAPASNHAVTAPILPISTTSAASFIDAPSIVQYVKLQHNSSSSAHSITSKSVLPAHCHVPIIHSYGAGGSGMTIHWGCAHDVLRLFAQAMPHLIPTDAEAAALLNSKLQQVELNECSNSHFTMPR